MLNKSFLVKILSALLILATAAFIQVTVAFANDGVLGFTPEGVYPVTQSDISMTAEDIYIQLFDHAKAKVTCRFDFKNFGSAQTVLMGFPAQLDDSVEISPGEELLVKNFTARDEDGDLEVTLVDTIPNPPMRNSLEKYKKWYSFSVDFDEGEEKTLYHTYEISFTYNSSGLVYMGYILETGALWKGALGHSKVVFDFGDIPMYTLEMIYPNNFYRIEGNKLIWERKDFEPTHNLWVCRDSLHYGEEWIKFCEENDDLRDQLDYIYNKTELFNTTADAIQKNRKAYYEEYETLVKSDPVCALYLKSALRLPNGNEKPEITGCLVEHRIGNSWTFLINGTDPDMDIVSCDVVIDGVDSYNYSDDEWDFKGLYYMNDEKNQFNFRRYLTVEGSGLFTVTFIVKDAYGNFDTKTMILQAGADDGEVSQEESIGTTENEPDEEEKELPVNQAVQQEPLITPDSNRIRPENDTDNKILVSVAVIILILAVGTVLYLVLKKKR